MTRPLITQKNLAAALLTLALALSAWMARTAFQQAGLAGCGGSCSEVLSSPWAYVGNLPVSVPGGMLYLATLLFCLLGKQGPARVLSAIILAGALYFVVIQAAVLRAFCPWCGITHLLASSAAILVLRVFPARDQPRRALIPVVSAGLAVALLFGAQILAPRKAGSMAAASPKTDYLVPMAGGQWTAHGRIQFTPSAFPSLIPSQAGEAGAPVLFLHDWTCSHCRQLHHDLAALDARERPSIFLIPASREAEGNAVHKLMTTAWVVDPALYERTAAALLAGTLQAVPADVVQALGTMQPSQEQSARAEYLLAIGESILSENDSLLAVSALPQLLSRRGLLTGTPDTGTLAALISGSRLPDPGPRNLSQPTGDAPASLDPDAESTARYRLLFLARDADPQTFAFFAEALSAGRLPTSAEVNAKLAAALNPERFAAIKANLGKTADELVASLTSVQRRSADPAAVLTTLETLRVPLVKGPQAAPAPPVPSKLAWEHTTLPSSPVPSGAVLKQTARFTNNLKAPVKVTNIKASCGCTVAGGADQTVAPAAHGEITIQINTAGQGIGQVAKSVTVLTAEEGRTCTTVLTIPYSITAAPARVPAPTPPLSLAGAAIPTRPQIPTSTNATTPKPPER